MRAGVRSQAPEFGPDATASTRAPGRVRFQSGDLVFGAFRLERPLSASGAVWRARGAGGVRYALKTGARAPIEREHALAAACAHPHVVLTLDRLESDGVSAIVFEYLSGGDLVSLAGSHPRHWLRPVADLVDALGHVHARGFVHRDVKARNVLLDEAGRSRLIDFGSVLPIGSRWTEAGTTAAARSPDRPDRPGGPAVPADDVLALAALIHELFLGRPPGAGSTAALEAVPEARPLARLAAAALGARPGAAACCLETFADDIKSSQRQFGMSV